MKKNLDNCTEFDEKGANFAQMFEDSQKHQTQGALQKGKIVQIGDEYAMVALSGINKAERRLDIEEIKKDGKLIFNVGDEIEVFVAGGAISYTKALRSKAAAQKIKDLKAQGFENKVIDAKIVKKNKGGYIMDFEGVDVFLPRREAAFKEDAKPEGKFYKAVITNIDEESGSIVASRKKFFDFDKENRQQAIKKVLDGDRIYEVPVKKVTNFGLFVDIENIEGLVHLTEISHRGPVNPEKLFKVGDSVRVKVKEYDEEKRRFKLSIKDLLQDPWEFIQKELEVGYTIKVVVSNIEEYGAFVDLGNNIEGFLHISEISWDKNIKHPNEYLKVNQELDVEIIEINPTNKKLRVSLKKLLKKPFDEFDQKHKAGDVVKGKVATITDFGAFINLGGVDGLLHNDDISWERGAKASDAFKVGDEVEVKISKIDSKTQRIHLSKKALSQSPVSLFAQKHKVDEIVDGKISEIKDFGIFVNIDGVDALIKNEDIPSEQRPELKVGDAIKCAVFMIDERAGKVRASIKKIERLQEKENLRAFNQSNGDDKMTLGDRLKK